MEHGNMAISQPSVADTKAIAEEGYIYGLPIVMNYAVMYAYSVDHTSPEFKAPFNKIKNEARVFTDKDTAIVTPNSDTPYSFLWLDLRAEPMVISVPAVEKSRYYAVQLEDGNTFNYGYIGSRTTGNEPGDYLVVGPDWEGKTPPGIKKVFHSTTQFSLAGFRTQLFNAEDMPNAVKVQAGYSPLHLRPQKSISPRSTKKRLKRISSACLTSYCNSRLQDPKRRRFERSLRESASGRARLSISRICLRSTRLHYSSA
jgi:hypothetical protein